jgi:hypothetical protein
MNAIWITSMILQWAVILVLVVLVLSLMRQLAERMPKATNEQDPEKIFPPFSELPETAVALLNGRQFRFGGAELPGTLIVFFSPKCGACEQLPEAIRALLKELPAADFTILAVLKRCTRDEARAFVREKLLDDVAVAVEEDFPQELNPGGAPFAAVLARGGNVAARGRPKVLEHLKEMVYAAEHMAHMAPDHSRRKHDWGESVPYWDPKQLNNGHRANLPHPEPVKLEA